MAVKTYILTKGKHTRFEFANGEPLTKANKARTSKEPVAAVNYSASGRNEIKMDSAEAGLPSYSHLGLVLKLEGKATTKTEKPAKAADESNAGDSDDAGRDVKDEGDLIAIPDDWRYLGLEDKRNLAARITGRRANRSVTTCDTIIQEYINGASASDD